MLISLRVVLLAVLLCFLTTACTAPPPPDGTNGFAVGRPPSLEKFCSILSPARQELSSWADFNPALQQSIRYVATRPPDETAFRYNDKNYSWNTLLQSLVEMQTLLPQLKDNPSLLAEHFHWIKIVPPTLFTGYYEPTIEASLEPSQEYPYPLYGVPEDLKPDVPYYDRKAIDGDGVLKGKKLEIAWIKDPVDGFFLQVQGSGRLSLPDGSSRHVLYAAHNEQPYVSLGKVCIERGLASPENMSMQTLRSILSEDAGRRDELLYCNPRYIFFKLAQEGPFGASGAQLTPMLSVAVDRSFLPLGAILMVDALLPRQHPGKRRRFSALLLAQDTGAFKGNHVDLFCGHTPAAASLAGQMRDKAFFWILLSKKALEQ